MVTTVLGEYSSSLENYSDIRALDLLQSTSVPSPMPAAAHASTYSKTLKHVDLSNSYVRNVTDKYGYRRQLAKNTDGLVQF